MSMGQRLADYRRARQMTLRDVQQATGVAFSYVNALERQDEWTGVSLGRVAKIASALNVAPGDLLGPEYLWGKKP